MAKTTQVEKIAKSMKQRGYDDGAAARIAQAATGKPAPKRTGKSKKGA